jgi:hypothetical protein
MGNFPHTDLTSHLVEDVEAIAHALCSENEKSTGHYEFTSVQFIRRVAKLQPHIYVQLLERSRQHHIGEEKWIFNAAHQAIGGALRVQMDRMGWIQERISNGDQDIFFQPTDKVIYRPAETVI